MTLQPTRLATLHNLGEFYGPNRVRAEARASVLNKEATTGPEPYAVTSENGAWFVIRKALLDEAK